ncbi:hypothetical protein JL722_7022 [Aureococcus anophagefferens]|nr:hypothetical protein JL722_7022 [Aureococcus anophagefferens]
MFWIFYHNFVVEPFAILILKLFVPASLHGKISFFEDPAPLAVPHRTPLAVAPSALVAPGAANAFKRGVAVPLRLRAAAHATPLPCDAFVEEHDVARDARADDDFRAIEGVEEAWGGARLVADNTRWRRPFYHAAVVTFGTTMVFMWPSVRAVAVKEMIAIAAMFVLLGVRDPALAKFMRPLDEANAAAPGLILHIISWVTMVGVACVVALVVKSSSSRARRLRENAKALHSSHGKQRERRRLPADAASGGAAAAPRRRLALDDLKAEVVPPESLARTSPLRVNSSYFSRAEETYAVAATANRARTRRGRCPPSSGQGAAHPHHVHEGRARRAVASPPPASRSSARPRASGSAARRPGREAVARGPGGATPTSSGDLARALDVYEHLDRLEDHDGEAAAAAKAGGGKFDKMKVRFIASVKQQMKLGAREIRRSMMS